MVAYVDDTELIDAVFEFQIQATLPRLHVCLVEFRIAGSFDVDCPILIYARS